MSGISAIGFDLDGTLLDHRAASGEALAHLVHAWGASPSPALERAWWELERRHLAPWRAGLIGFDEQRRRRVRDFLPMVVGADEERGDAELDAMFSVYLSAYEAAWRVYAEADAVLTAVRAAGLPVGLLTNGATEQQERKLAAVGIRDRFDVVCVSEAIGAAKPDAAAFAYLCSGLGVPPAEVLFVGDDYGADILGGRAAGLQTYFVNRGDREADAAGDAPAPGHPDLLGLLRLLP